MDHQDIRTLKIIEELDKEQVPSQRDLARELNISLGLVNSFIKRLVNKGFFKITNIPANRVKYILTPKGAAEKTRLTYEYIQYSFGFYKTARQKVRELLQELAAQGVKQMIFCGVGDFAEIAYISLQEFSIDLVAIMDGAKAGKNFLGHKVVGFSQVESLDCDKILITAIESSREIHEMLMEKGIPAEKIAILQER